MNGVPTDCHSQLLRGLSILGIPDPEGAGIKLEGHLNELEKWNARHGLVKASGEELVVRHVLDSLSAWKDIRSLVDERPDRAAPGTVLDVGSGAGFPGIPLAIVLPRIAFTLLERSSVRAAFLKNCAVLLKLSNVAVLESDLSALTGNFDVLTMRAFSPLSGLLENLAKSRVEWKVIAAYKGKEGRLTGEVEALGDSSFDVEVRSLEAPFLDEERHLAVIRRRG
jgi:16S rRNA (guanine527-N7)-methyltransferase